MEIKEENSRRRELSAEPGSWCAATACINGAQAILSPVGFRTSVGYNFDRPPRADVAKLADAPDLGSGFERSGGSSPLIRTILLFQSTTAAGMKFFQTSPFLLCASAISCFLLIRLFQLTAVEDPVAAHAKFASEEACRNIRAAWHSPDGFVWPRCGRRCALSLLKQPDKHVLSSVVSTK